MIRGEKYIAPAAATLALTVALGGTACGGKSLETSPPAYSHPYPADPNAYGGNPINWPNAIVADVQVPKPPISTDVIIGFEKPGTDDWITKDFTVDPTESSEFLLRIGRAPVEFEVRLRGPNGSKMTKIPPTVKFEGPEPVAKAKRIPGIRLGGANGWESR